MKKLICACMILVCVTTFSACRKNPTERVSRVPEINVGTWEDEGGISTELGGGRLSEGSGAAREAEGPSANLYSTPPPNDLINQSQDESSSSSSVSNSSSSTTGTTNTVTRPIANRPLLDSEPAVELVYSGSGVAVQFEGSSEELSAIQSQFPNGGTWNWNARLIVPNGTHYVGTQSLPMAIQYYLYGDTPIMAHRYFEYLQVGDVVSAFDDQWFFVYGVGSGLALVITRGDTDEINWGQIWSIEQLANLRNAQILSRRTSFE